MSDLTPERARARSLVARVFGATLGALATDGVAAASQRAIARRLDVSQASVQRWADATSGKALPLDALLAAGPTVAREVLRRLLAELDGEDVPAVDPGRLALTLAARVGVLASKQQEFIADNHYSPREWRDLAGLFASIESVARIGRLASERAAGGGQ